MVQIINVHGLRALEKLQIPEFKKPRTYIKSNIEMRDYIKQDNEIFFTLKLQDHEQFQGIFVKE